MRCTFKYSYNSRKMIIVSGISFGCAILLLVLHIHFSESLLSDVTDFFTLLLSLTMALGGYYRWNCYRNLKGSNLVFANAEIYTESNDGAKTFTIAVSDVDRISCFKRRLDMSSPSSKILGISMNNNKYWETDFADYGLDSKFVETVGQYCSAQKIMFVNKL